MKSSRAARIQADGAISPDALDGASPDETRAGATTHQADGTLPIPRVTPMSSSGSGARASCIARDPYNRERARCWRSVLWGRSPSGCWAGITRTHLPSAGMRSAPHRPPRATKPRAIPPLPSLGPIDLPEVPVEKILGPAPAEPPIASDPIAAQATVPSTVGGQPVTKSPTEMALERRLAGPAFSRRSDNDSTSGASPAADGTSPTMMGAPGGPVLGERESGGASGRGALPELLKPTLTPAVLAQVLPTERLLLPKGAFIDCTLETAIDSTLPGMTTCITATDTFSADGSTVLMERGTKLVGETRGEVRARRGAGLRAVDEARTPTGVVDPVELAGDR